MGTSVLHEHTFSCQARERISAADRDAIIAPRRRKRALATNSTRQTTWIVLTVALGAAVVGLAIWAVVLQRDQDDANVASAARIDELEQQNAELEAQVSDLGEQVTALQQDLDDAQASAESAADEAQSALEAARGQLEEATGELGAKGDQLAESEAEIERLAAAAEAAVAEAESATASAQDRADAEAARADLAEACLGAVADVLRRLYASDDVAEALERAAEELEAIAADCEQA
jgi:chromosome segregation ATPase